MQNFSQALKNRINRTLVKCKKSILDVEERTESKEENTVLADFRESLNTFHEMVKDSPVSKPKETEKGKGKK